MNIKITNGSSIPQNKNNNKNNKKKTTKAIVISPKKVNYNGQ